MSFPAVPRDILIWSQIDCIRRLKSNILMRSAHSHVFTEGGIVFKTNPTAAEKESLARLDEIIVSLKEQL